MHRFENIGWTVGNYCNAACGHCYSWKVRRDSKEFLTKEDVDTVISQLKSLGVKTVNLGGNEPIYTHGPNLDDTLLPYIIRRLNKAKIPVGLTTNGASFEHLDKYYPNELKMINDIDFSLDSPFKEEHDKNRATKLYDLVVRSIQRSVELEIDCSIIACGMKLNFNSDYLSAYLSLTKVLGCEFRINTLKPVEKALINQMPLRDQFYDAFSFLLNNTDCITLGESCLTAFTESGSQGCPCGTTSFRINAKTAEGKIPINPCVYMHDFKTGDLLSQDIFDIINSSEFTSFANRRENIPKECKDSNCQYMETCRGGCSARSFLIYGNLDSKDPYCPQDYVNEHETEPKLPKNINIGCAEGFRVHDNYLCTWIGEVKPDFNDKRYGSLQSFCKLSDKENGTQHMSGCRQVKKKIAPSTSDSLVPFSPKK